MKQKALVWFTGIISQFSVSKDYNIRRLNINRGTLSKLLSKYDITFLIYVKDEHEQQDYQDLLFRNNLTYIPCIFIPYDISFKEFLVQYHNKCTDFILIDYSKKRLLTASTYLQRTDMIHVSQLLD